MIALDPGAAARSGLILVHLLSFAGAAAAIGLADYAIFARRPVDVRLLQRAAAGVSVALAALWLSGLGVLWIDTRLDPNVLAMRPKTLAKLTVVLLLSANGIALHRCVLPALARAQADPVRAAALPTVIGAASAVSWLFAACIGVDKVVAGSFGYGVVMGLYGLALSAGLSIAWLAVRPALARRLAAPPAPAALNGPGSPASAPRRAPAPARRRRGRARGFRPESAPR